MQPKNINMKTYYQHTRIFIAHKLVKCVHRSQMRAFRIHFIKERESWKKSIRNCWRCLTYRIVRCFYIFQFNDVYSKNESHTFHFTLFFPFPALRIFKIFYCTILHGEETQIYGSVFLIALLSLSKGWPK